MSLKIWLPLNGNIENQGLADVIITNNGATVDNNGKIGKCYSFNGGTITAPAPKITNKITVAAWIKAPNNNSGWRRVCGMQSAAISWQSASALLMLNGTNLYFSISNGSTCTSGGCVFNIGDSSNWFHACGTYDGTTARLYVNGVLKKEFAIATTIENTPIWLGGTSAGERFTGKLNDFRLYDHCLSPKEVKEISKGLVLHYPLNDAYVEGTTNINGSGSKTITDTCYNRATGQYNYGPTTDMYRIDGIFQGKQCTKVYMGTDGLDAHPSVYFYPLHPANGAYKTLSFDYFPTICNNIGFYTYGGSATTSYVVNGIKSTSSDGAKTIPVNIGQWNHIEFTLLGTSDSTGGWGYMQIGNTNHTSSTSNYWLFANVQIEEKDHATPYTPNTRNETTVYDCSGYQNNGTITRALSCSADSPRYKTCVQTSSSGKIQKDVILPSAITHYTISVWCKITDPNAAANLWTKHSNGSKGIIQGPDGGWIYSYNGEGLITRTSFLTTSGTITQTYPGFGQNYKDGNWHMYTIVGNGNINTCYLDGVMTGRSTLSNFVSYNISGQLNIGFTEECLVSDYRCYATALSEEDIKELYNTSAYVSDNGTLLTYNLEE